MLKKDNEISNDHDYDDGNTVTTGAVQGNVRTKVSTWLANLVDEVRRKSPVPLQKWNDPSGCSENSPSEAAVIKEQIDRCGIRESSSSSSTTTSPPPRNASPITNQPENINKFWMRGSILSKFNKSFDESQLKPGNELETTKQQIPIGQYTSLGRLKINQFYDKVFLTKAKYNSLKAQKMDTKLDNSATEIKSNLENQNSITTKLPSSSCSGDNIDSSFDDLPEFSEKLKLNEIGRTISPSRNPILDANNSKRLYLSSPPKNIALGNIGRSFSEQDDEDDEYMLNERSRSCSHSIFNRKLLRNNSINNNNNVSTSLPSFLEDKCIPVTSPSRLRTTTTGETCMLSDSPRRGFLMRDSSVQSDSSHCSSVESLLESRKPDPEAILINLGFGPVETEDILAKIPKRFLKPSQVRGIDTEAFLRRQQMASHLHDHSVLGYRGLLGNPDIPPSTIVAKIMERFEMNERNHCIMDVNLNRPQSAPPTPGPNT